MIPRHPLPGPARCRAGAGGRPGRLPPAFVEAGSAEMFRDEVVDCARRSSLCRTLRING